MNANEAFTFIAAAAIGYAIVRLVYIPFFNWLRSFGRYDWRKQKWISDDNSNQEK